MKKIICLAILLAALGSQLSWAIPDFLGATEYSASGQVSATNAYVCSIVFTDIGGTAGDKVQVLNSTTSSGSSEITLTAATANATITQTYNPCVLFTTGIYVKFTGTGTFAADIQYTNTL